MNTYFETSAILKLVVAEHGTDAAEELWDASDLVVTSRLSYPESRAALAAARRARRLTAGQLREAKRALDSHFREIDVIEVTQLVAAKAGDLAEHHGLRGYDAVHLASALAFDTESVVLATWDRDLARAARAVGFALAGPAQ